MFMRFYGFADPLPAVLQKEVVATSIFSGQHYENFCKALHKNFNCHSPPLSTWMNENI